MQLTRIICIMALAFLILAIFPINNLVYAEDVIGNDIDANFNIEMISATDFKINVDFIVNKLTLSGSENVYTRNDIKTIASSNQELLGAIKHELQIMLYNTITKTFNTTKANKNAVISASNVLPTYENDKFYNSFTVNLSSAFFGMKQIVNAYNFLNGVLNMGAKVNYDINLQAELGWDNIYTIILPASLYCPFTSGSVSGNKIRWEVKNSDGTQNSRLAKMTIQRYESTPTIPKTEDIKLEFELNTRNIEKTSLKTKIIMKTIDISEYNVLPAFITNLNFLPADGIRLFVENEFISWDKIHETTITPLKDKVISKIESSSLNQTLDMVFNWDLNTTTNCLVPYDTVNMDDDPPVKAEFIDSDINLKICNIPSRVFFGLSKAGAKANISSTDINFGDKLNEIGYPYTGLFYLPNNVTLDGENIYRWNSSKPISGKIDSDGPEYNEEKIETIVKIELGSTDLNLFSVFTGKTELLLGLYLEEEQNCSVITLPSEFYLPKQISIKYLNSDAIRLCIEENVFTSDDVNNFLNSKKQLFNSLLSGVLTGLKVDGRSDRGEFDRSLVWDKDISRMDDDLPIKVVSYAHSSYSVNLGVSFSPPAFDFSNLIFNFVGQENQKVTYRIVFPKGLSSVEYDDPSGKAFLGKTEDGRYYLETTFDEDESGASTMVTCKMVPSPLFMLSILMPCILSLIIFVILIVVIIVIRRKRRFGGKKPRVKARKEEEEKEFGGYEEQDYYVPPPPPPSSR
ncbi:MAG: hypothetical protein QHH19_04860 [Candidatus Thermoplasmatota archaeon]|nr:hypothetical protein [Candidatus Thermoplasmatota archaeon]